MEYTPQHEMFNQKRLQILNMYNNASDILKGEDNKPEEKEEELEFEDEEESEEEVEKGDTEEDFEEEGEEDDDFEKGGPGSGRHGSGFNNVSKLGAAEFQRKLTGMKKDHEVHADTEDGNNLALLYHKESGKHVGTYNHKTEEYHHDIEKSEPTELTKSEAFDILESSFDIDLIKGGEGSKGGKVIGHTKSGKPIYENHNHESHSSFSADDHKNAVKAHTEEYNGHKEDFNSYKSSGQANHPDARESKERMEHHKEQAQLHRNSLK